MSGTASGSRQLVDRGWRYEEGRPLEKSAERGQDVAQASLPPLRWLMQPDECRFAHEAEIEFARLLSFYGIRWAYEPTMFAVRWDADGNPVEFVTPDFYLPDFDAYVELTTMRQRLVTRKNRKFRHLREQYPNVRVRMLYLRDFERLRRTYRSDAEEFPSRIVRTVAAASEVGERITSLAGDIVEAWHALSREERGQRPLLIGLGPGSSRFLESLGASVRDTGTPVDCCRVDLSRHAGGDATAKVRLIRPPSTSVAGRPVVIAQEVLSTGLSAAYLVAWLRKSGATSVAVCALLDRDAARIVDVPLLSRGFGAPDSVLGGFGLSRWRAYRHLPYIAEIETS